VLPSLLSHPVETLTGPSKAHWIGITQYYTAFLDADSNQYAFGGPGGSRTHVQNAFALKGLQQYLNFTLIFAACQITQLIINLHLHLLCNGKFHTIVQITHQASIP